MWFSLDRCRRSTTRMCTSSWWLLQMLLPWWRPLRVTSTPCMSTSVGKSHPSKGCFIQFKSIFSKCLLQGSYWSWKSWKSLEFHCPFFKHLKVLEFETETPGKSWKKYIKVKTVHSHPAQTFTFTPLSENIKYICIWTVFWHGQIGGKWVSCCNLNPGNFEWNLSKLLSGKRSGKIMLLPWKNHALAPEKSWKTSWI